MGETLRLEKYIFRDRRCPRKFEKFLGLLARHPRSESQRTGDGQVTYWLSFVSPNQTIMFVCDRGKLALYQCARHTLYEWFSEYDQEALLELL